MSETIYLGPTEFRASAGKFRTTRRYLRADAVGAPLTVLAQSRTVDCFVISTGQLTWRYSVNGTVVQYSGAGASSFNAAVKAVKI